MKNLNKYVNHIYYISNNTTSYFDNLNCKNIVTQFTYNLDKPLSILYNYKKEAYIRCIKDALYNKYEKILILSDNIEFTDKIENVLSNLSGDICIINPGDINEDCVFLNKNAIELIGSQHYDFSKTNWYRNIVNLVKSKLQITKSECQACYHKIDYVMTYVNCDDENWQNEYYKYKSNIDYLRFKDYGTLKLNVDLVRKNMPWINNIYVVISSYSQIKENLNNVKIVLHKDIIPKEFLPTFNSRTIEMFLSYIPGLSEYWIYANDDMFVTNYIDKKDLYTDGKIITKYEDIKNNSQYDIVCNNSYNFCKSFFNKQMITMLKNKPKKLFHTIHPYLKSSALHIYKLQKYNIYNSITRFREQKNLNQYIYGIYEYLQNNYLDSKLKFNYKEYIEIDNIEKNSAHTICCNNVINNIINTENHDLKVAVCAIAKNENLYIREWIEWYKNLGICKIFLYDNNDLDGERFEEVINDYIEEGFVEVIDKRGVTITINTDKTGESLQGLCYIDCYNRNYYKYNWICFFDCDEYLTIDYKYNNIYDFLLDYKTYDGINVQWRMYGDNNQIYYINDTLHNRFKCKENEGWDSRTKTIINTDTYYNYIFCAHGPLNYKKLKLKYVNINFEDTLNIYRTKNIHKNLPVYLDHFYSKSTEEFFKRKYMKTSAVTGINGNRNFNKQFLYEQYFLCNKITQDKLDFINKYESQFVNTIETNTPEKPNIKKALINVYVASLFRDGHIIDMLKSIINQPEVHTITVSCNNYTDDECNKLKSEIKSSKLILKHTKNEKKSFEKLKFVNEGNSLYVAFCDDDLIYPSFYFRKMLYECSKLNSPVSYHGAKFIKLPLTNYYKERKMFSFSMNVKEKTMVDIIGNGVSLMKRDFLSKDEWESLYNDAPDTSMDDITISYLLRKKGYNLYVVKHSAGEVYERENNKQIDTVYMTYKNNCDIQTNWINKNFITLN